MAAGDAVPAKSSGVADRRPAEPFGPEKGPNLGTEAEALLEFRVQENVHLCTFQMIFLQEPVAAVDLFGGSFQKD